MASIAARMVLLAFALGCVSLAAGQSYTSVTLQLTEVALPNSQINVGTNFGDTQYFRNQIYDFNTGALLGHDQGPCVYTQGLDANGNYELECSFTFVLGAGSFTVTGQFRNTPSALAVAGGTGAYSGADGVCVQSTLSDDGKGTTVFGYNCQFFVLTPSITLDPLTPKATTAQVGVAPVNGVCNSSSSNPNPCFAANGLSSICCPGQCPTQPADTPACA